MKILILAVGMNKDKALVELIQDYLKRLKKYALIQIIEIKESSLTDQDPQKALDQQKTAFLKHIPMDAYVVALELLGNQLTSEDFAKKITELVDQGKITGGNQLVFCVGGSIGLPKEVNKRANFKLSFSKMTFPHKLFRLMLVEQIYRAFTILRQEPYHK